MGTLEMLTLDVRYVRIRSLRTDMRILLRTAAGVAVGQRRAVTTAFVATTGGHLTQLVDLAERIPRRPRLGLDHPRERAEHVAARGPGRASTSPTSVSATSAGVLRCVLRAHALYRSRRPTRAVSTGSGIALAYLPYLAARGVECHYIESAARVGGPSLTGRSCAGSPACAPTRSTATGATRTGTTAAAASTRSSRWPRTPRWATGCASWSRSARRRSSPSRG